LRAEEAARSFKEEQQRKAEAKTAAIKSAVKKLSNEELVALGLDRMVMKRKEKK
jgi:hypothetical protein